MRLGKTDPTWLGKIILKFFLRWPQNRAILLQSDQNFKRKSISPKSSVIYDIYGLLPIKIHLHPPGTPNPPKNWSRWSKKHVFWGFGVPGGCKSILNVKSLYKSYIAELFGPRVFCFSVGRKKSSIAAKWLILCPP